MVTSLYHHCKNINNSFKNNSEIMHRQEDILDVIINIVNAVTLNFYIFCHMCTVFVVPTRNELHTGREVANKRKLTLENQIFCMFGRQFRLLTQQALPSASKEALPNIISPATPLYHVAKCILWFLAHSDTCVEISW